MIRLQINVSAGELYTHNCVHCGCVVQYYEDEVGTCKICKTGQRLVTSEGRCSVPFKFLEDADKPMWRMTYHLEETNVD